MSALRWGLAAAAGVGAAMLCAPGTASASPSVDTPAGPSAAVSQPAHRGAARAQRVKPAAATAPRARRSTGVSVDLPQVPIRNGWSFTVSQDAIAAQAGRYVAAGGDAGDAPRFFFGDLAVRSLDALAGPAPSRDEVRTQLGNLAVSGYFGGVWLRDNLRAGPTPTPAPGTSTATTDLTISAVGTRLFDALAVGLTAAADAPPLIATTAAHLSIPALLALYGYNRGYLEVLLDNPPPGVASMKDTLSCQGFLSCTSSVVPAEIATRYDGALTNLAHPAGLGWVEMSAWTSVMEAATGAGRLVWNLIASGGGFSPASYAALVDLSSTYLMVSKAAVLSSMEATVDGNADLARSSLLLQAGLWMWSGAYFGGLASSAPRGTLPSITVGD